MLTNWKTSLTGLFAGLMILVGGALHDRSVDPHAPAVTLEHLAPAFMLALLGGLAKDYDGKATP